MTEAKTANTSNPPLSEALLKEGIERAESLLWHLKHNLEVCYRPHKEGAWTSESIDKMRIYLDVLDRAITADAAVYHFDSLRGVEEIKEGGGQRPRRLWHRLLALLPT